MPEHRLPGQPDRWDFHRDTITGRSDGAKNGLGTAAAALAGATKFLRALEGLCLPALP